MRTIFLFLCVLLCSLVVVFADQTASTTQATSDNFSTVLMTAISSLFGILLIGLRVFWTWITAQFEDMKKKISHVEEKLDKERDDQDKRMDNILNKFLAQVRSDIKTERIDRNENKPIT